MGHAVRLRHGVWALLILVGAAQGALAQSAQRSSSPIRDLQVSDIFVPAEVGYVTEATEPPAGSVRAPLVIHIQEAHTNYEAQRHLVSILEQLIQDHGLKLILVEGGRGDVSLAYLRAYGSPDNRRAVADKYLKAGIISGEEYLDIVSDHPLILWGVEQDDLYQRNLEAFIEAEELRATVIPTLAAVRQTVQSLKSELSNPELTDLQVKADAFRRAELGLADYAEALAGAAARQGIAETEYSHLQRFRAVRRLEQALDLAAVQQEQQALTKELSVRADGQALADLVAQAQGMKDGKVTREAFYTRLEQLAVASNLRLDDSPHLASYITYVKERAQVQTTALSTELDTLAARLQEALATTPESRQLQEIEQQLLLVENLVALRLSPSEHQSLQAAGLSGLCAGWDRFLSTQAGRHGLQSPSAAQLREVDQALPTLWGFYTAASTRDEALVGNAMAKIRETQEPLAVLITGGFHSPQITKRLQDAGVGTVVVAPKVTRATDEELYRAVVKYKSGHGSYEDVMAIANRAAPAASLP